MFTQPVSSIYCQSIVESNLLIFRSQFHFLSSHSTISTSDSDQQRQIQINRNRKLKNQLCRNYLNNGYCRYYDRCQFAHGIEQLRQSQKCNMKYKTKECQSYILKGYCIYGERCNFVHVHKAKNNQWSSIKHAYKQLVSKQDQFIYLNTNKYTQSNQLQNSKLFKIINKIEHNQQKLI